MTGDERNDQFFAEALSHLRNEAEGFWRQQLELLLGHPVELTVGYESLGGRYELVQPFVHQAVAGTLTALSRLAFDPARGGPLRAAVVRVVIVAGKEGEECDVTIADGALTSRVPLGPDGSDPTPSIDAAIRHAVYYVVYPDADRILNQDAAVVESPVDFDAAESDMPAGESQSHFAAPVGNVYERATQLIAQLEDAMRETELWPGAKPDGPIEVKGAFGSENMTFGQWLAWVLIPRVQEIVAERGEFPKGSMLGPYAVRELDGFAGLSEVHEVLYAIDELASS